MSKGTTKSNDPIDLFEMNQSGDTELQRLQKQLRQMEKEQQQFTEDKNYKQSKKLKIIESLKTERNKLKDEVNSITQGPHAKRASHKELKMEKILNQKDELERKYEEQKMNLWELEAHIKKIEFGIRDVNEKQLNEKKHKKQTFKVQKSLNILENQLDVLNKRCGEIMAENANLRFNIDHMLIERANFNEMWQKMVQKHEQGKKFILDLTDQAIAAYDQREELCNKIQNLKDKGLTESTLHIQEMRELQRKLDHDFKLQQFFEIKGQQRANAELEIREAQKKLQVQMQLETQLQEYDRILDSIKVLCEEHEIDKLSKLFTKQEEENFALFNYVNELSHEVETLNEVVQQLQDETEVQKGETQTKEEGQMMTIDLLENDYELQLEKVKETETIHLNVERNLDELLQGIEKLFKLVRVGDVPILELFGDHSQITIYNVKLFLGIVKLKANFIISCINFTDQPSKILAKKDRIPKFNVKVINQQHK